MPFNYVNVISCGSYYPYKVQGEINPKCDAQSRKMMDFKDPNNKKHKKAIEYFSAKVITKLSELYFTNPRRQFTAIPFIITIVPSHQQGKISGSLKSVALDVCKAYPLGSYEQILHRHTTVPSSHKSGGVRSVDTHSKSIVTLDKFSFQNRSVLVLDDVTTSGSTLTSCTQLLRSDGATAVTPMAILETCY